MSDNVQPFSRSSVADALDELFDAIPKTRRFDHIGALNEVSVFVDVAYGMFVAGVDDDDRKAELRRSDIRVVLRDYVERMTPT